MGENRRPISVREGRILIDGVAIADAVSCSIKYTPDIGESKTLGQKGKSRRYLGHDVTGEITEYRSTGWLLDAIAQYQKTRITPEFTIQGIMDDPDSEYYGTLGSQTVTATGCVLTGDVTLLQLDASGDFVQDTIAFGAVDVIVT